MSEKIFHNFYNETIYKIEDSSSAKLVDHHQKLLIILPHAADQLAIADRNLAKKMLQAVNFELKAEMMLDINLPETRYKYLRQNPDLKFIISFGCTPKELGLQIEVKHYQLAQLDQCTLLFAPPLFHITDNTQKRPLWGAMKQMFSV